MGFVVGNRERAENGHIRTAAVGISLHKRQTARPKIKVNIVYVMNWKYACGNVVTHLHVAYHINLMGAYMRRHREA